MDGYAIRSQVTVTAGFKRPVKFRIVGRIAAGDDPDNLALDSADMSDNDEAKVCVEIMTGAVFPAGYDACVKMEDTILHEEFGPGQHHHQSISVSKPVPHGANRRLAGFDMQRGQTILREGETLRLAHVLPLASAGFTSVSLVRPPRVGILSTGKELLRAGCSDINGPYLVAATTALGALPDFLGIVDDNMAQLELCLHEAGFAGNGYDVIVSSGAVSKGRFDFVRAVLDRMGAEVVFHGLAIRPGHPVLFALLRPACGSGSRIPFFGLPGNPGAAAACFHFLVVPYLRAMQGQPREQPRAARLVNPPKVIRSGLDYFQHGALLVGAGGELAVELSRDQSPAKLGPFVSANCWVHLNGRTGGDGVEHAPEIVDCYTFSGPGV